MSIRKQYPEIARTASSEATERLGRMLKFGFEIHGANDFGNAPMVWVLNLSSGHMFVSGLDTTRSTIKDVIGSGDHASAIEVLAQISGKHPQKPLSQMERDALGQAAWIYMGGTSVMEKTLELGDKMADTRPLDGIILLKNAPRHQNVDLRPAVGFGVITRDAVKSVPDILAFSNHILEMDRTNSTGWFNPSRR